MTIIRWNPWREIEEMADRYTGLVGQAQTGGQEVVATGDWAPRVDIAETEDAFEIKAELPDVKKEDVKVSVYNGVLTLRGERKREEEESGKKFHRVERKYGSFTRSFTLPDNVDENNIKAAFNDGILNLQIHKTEEAKPKAIEVNVQ